MEEVWKDVVGYEGLYEVSSLGRVRSVDRIVAYRDGRKRFFKSAILQQRASTTSKYLSVPLYKDAKMKRHRVHRLVAEAFVPNPEEKPQVGHKDENYLNNAASNLEWVTIRENNSMPIHKARISGANNGMYGRPMTDKQKEILRKANLGRVQTAEEKAKRVQSRGHVVTRRVGVECDGMTFYTMKDFADYYGIDPCNPAKWHSGKKKTPLKWLNMNIKFIDEARNV